MKDSKGEPPSVSSAFSSTLSTLAAKPGEHEITVSWNFTNRWDIPLVVERFEESCGCLSGVVSNESVAPGKTDQIRGIFAPGGYRGKVRKSLHVRFVGHDKPVELVAEVTVLSSVELSKTVFVWRGVDTSPKSVDVKAGIDVDFNITALAGVPSQAFSIKQETVRPGRHYRITITPAANAASAVECLQIRTDSADLRDRVLAVFLTTVAATTVAATTVPTP